MTTKIEEIFRKVPYMSEEEIKNSKLNLDVFKPVFNPIDSVDLNYKPIICKAPEDADEDGYHVENDGIGGSDAGAVLGLNPNRSPLLVAQQKSGIVAKEEPDTELQYMFDYGHAQEIPLLTYFVNKYGYKVWRDRAQYQHPLYPWMKADIDGFVEFDDGEIALLECKTFSHNPKVTAKWNSGVYGEGGQVGHKYYIAQAIHNMAVMNVNKMIFLANSGNLAQDFVWVIVNRDLEKEKALINAEGEFWIDLQKGILPEEHSINKAVFDTFVDGYSIAKKSRRLSSKNTFVELPKIILSDIEAIQDIDLDISLNKEEKLELDNKKNAFKENIIFALGDSSRGFIDGYEVSLEETKKKVLNEDKLQLMYPEAYEDCMETKTGKPTFKIRKMGSRDKYGRRI